MKKLPLSVITLCLFWACESKKDYQQQADSFISAYSQEYHKLYTASAEAEWVSNTKIVEGDWTNAIIARQANEAIAAFTGKRKYQKNQRITGASRWPFWNTGEGTQGHFIC